MKLPEGTRLLSDLLDADGYPVRAIRVQATTQRFINKAELYGRVDLHGGYPPFEIVDVIVSPVDNTDYYCDSGPFIRLDENAARELMDSLWAAGVRPSDTIRSQVDDSHKHLEDMRKIAFATLKKLEIEV